MPLPDFGDPELQHGQPFTCQDGGQWLIGYWSFGHMPCLADVGQVSACWWRGPGSPSWVASRDTAVPAEAARFSTAGDAEAAYQAEHLAACGRCGSVLHAACD
jgi:hypothetical protein